MDVQMPEMDGIEATQHIRRLADPVKANIPIIALTANALKGDSEKYIAAGMTDYLAKPFDEARLFRVISRNLPGNNNHNNNMAVENSRLYDLSMVQSVSGGDEGFIKKMVALFIETVPQNIQDLKNALQEENWELVGKTAHKLKSTIDSMGIKSIRQEIRTVEANARQKEGLDEVPSLVTTIDSVIKETIGQLKAEVLK
jgi:response regulator RpfG family c-di-GMP phosphodiesterase